MEKELSLISGGIFLKSFKGFKKEGNNDGIQGLSGKQT
jgi:hypothetical protein